MKGHTNAYLGIILDCCRELVKDKTTRRAPIVHPMANTWIMYPCDDGEYAYPDKSADKLGVFTKHVVPALRREEDVVRIFRQIAQSFHSDEAHGDTHAWWAESIHVQSVTL